MDKQLSLGKRPPCLSVLLVGEDPASQVYVGHKEKACKAVGFASETYRISASATTAEVIAKINALNLDEKVDGILLQLPLPNGFDSQACVQAIDWRKDVDGLTALSQGRLVSGLKGMRPCTPSGVIDLIEHAGFSLEGKNAVVLGRSILVGAPVARLLMDKNATVTIAHSRTPNTKELCQNADVVVAAAGKPELVRADWIKEGAVVIDVGIHRSDKGLIGDVAFSEVQEVAGAITPVPGGVGPMTIAKLLENCFEAYLAANS